MTAPSRLPAGWPHREFSRSLRVGALDWHVQVAGQGPVLLLLHGSGASAHSWAGLLPALVKDTTVSLSPTDRVTSHRSSAATAPSRSKLRETDSAAGAEASCSVKATPLRLTTSSLSPLAVAR